MSTDLRNSIYLWSVSIVCFALFWAGSQLDAFHGLSKTWIGPLAGVLGLINLGRFIWGLSRRRASDPNNPNRS